MLSLWNPAETIAHGADKQVSVAIEHGGTKQEILTRQISEIDKIVIHLPITIIKDAMNANHHHTTLVA